MYAHVIHAFHSTQISYTIANYIHGLEDFISDLLSFSAEVDVYSFLIFSLYSDSDCLLTNSGTFFLATANKNS